MTDPERKDAWDAMALLHDALSELSPPGSLPSKEEIDRLFGATIAGYAEAFAQAVSTLHAVAYPAVAPKELPRDSFHNECWVVRCD